MIRRPPRPVLVVLGIAAGVGLAIVIWLGTGRRDPGSLAVGDCFDVPAASQRIEDIRGRACGGPHGGEVFHVFAEPDGATTYPTDADWEELIYPVCDPVFESYTGTPVGERFDIGYLFLVPTADRWAAGDRRVTCFISSLDGSPLSRSYRERP